MTTGTGVVTVVSVVQGTSVVTVVVESCVSGPQVVSVTVTVTRLWLDSCSTKREANQ